MRKQTVAVSALALLCGLTLVWWFQNMPGYNSGQTYSDGRPMPSLWPFLFY